MGLRTGLALLVILLIFSSSWGQTSSLRRAQEAFHAAEDAEASLRERPASERSRSAYLRVIDAYERVYLITPHTSYADDALLAVARLYEEIGDVRAAVRSLEFLIQEYPQTPFREAARRNITRLTAPREVRETPSQTGKNAAVENVKYWEEPNSVRVVIELNGPITFKQGEAKSPDRVFLDISPARLNPALIGKEWPLKSKLLQKIRVGQYDASTVRLVLDVGVMRDVTSFMLRDPDRLIVDIVGDQAPVATTASSTSAPAPATAAAPAPATAVAADSRTPPATPTPSAPGIPPPADVKGAVTPAKPTNSGNHSLIRSLGLKISRVVIDPGHGGHDTGSIGPTGYTEKELVLDIAKRLETLIERELGAEVMLTRTDDTFVPLETRTAMANQQQADLFISIHANSSRTRSVRGVETFFLGLTNSREALETAARENAASERSIHELQDVVKQIMMQDKAAESRELAAHIQKAMAKGKGASQNRGIKQAQFFVLIGANMPSILAETSFISNPEEERQLKTAKYRQQIAESILAGIRSYSETLSGVKTAN